MVVMNIFDEKYQYVCIPPKAHYCTKEMSSLHPPIEKENTSMASEINHCYRGWSSFSYVEVLRSSTEAVTIPVPSDLLHSLLQPFLSVLYFLIDKSLTVFKLFVFLHP